MRVIHGIWAHGALCLWAEDPGPAARFRVRTDYVRLPRPHPFACQAAELADMLAGRPGTQDPGHAVGQRGPQGRPRRADPAAALARRRAAGLTGTHPARGPGARVHGRSGSGQARLDGCRWPAGGCRCSPSRPRPRSRCSAGSGRPDDSAATAGGSLTYLAAVARFAADLAARGRVLPVLADEGETYAARWRPVLGGADAQRAHDLAAAMPPSCRAAGGEAPGTLLASALDCAGRCRRAGPAARLAAAPEAGPDPGAPSGGRTIRAGPDHDRCPPRGGDAAGRGFLGRVAEWASK